MKRHREATELFDALASGEQSGPVDPELVARFVHRSRKLALSWDPSLRLRALRAAAALGPAGLLVADQLRRDPSTKLRRAALIMAISANADGVSSLRGFTEDSDPEIAAEALDRLADLQDKGSLKLAGRLLESDHAGVRCRAATLLGVSGSRSAVPALQRVQATETDDAVSKAISAALDQLTGSHGRPSPTPWWPDDAPKATTLQGPPVDLEIDDAPADKPPPNPATRLPPYLERKLAEEGRLPYELTPEDVARLATTAEDRMTAAKAGTQAVEPPPAAGELIAPAESALTGPDEAHALAAPQPGTQPVRVQLPDLPDNLLDGQWAALPEDLPTETRAQVKLLGMVGPADRPAVLALLTVPAAVGSLLASYRAGIDPALGRGLALAAAGWGRDRWLRAVQKLLADPHPIVRGGAAEAVGVLGKPASVPALSRLVDDPEPGVRREAAKALASLGDRVGRANLVKPHLQRLESDKDASVKALATQLLKDMES